MSSSLNRRDFLASAASARPSLRPAYSGAPSAYLPNQAEIARPSPSSQTPQWVRQGIVTASNMEALFFIRRRGGEETDCAEQWQDGLSDATVRTLVDQGVNLIIVTLHKGAGLKTEAQDIAVAREFVELAHKRGLRVCGYVGATLFYETFEVDEPRSKGWKQIDEFGNPIYYLEPGQTFRYMACRNNPEYLAYIKEVLKLGVQNLRMDMIFFDQMMWAKAPASCHCDHCKKLFKEFLKNRYPADLALLRFGFENVELLSIPPFGNNSGQNWFAELANPLMQEWILFRAWSLAERFKELTGYIHQLNPETALLGNPAMNLEDNVGFVYGIDYGQLLEGCDTIFSEEANQPLWTDDGRLISQIRTYKGVRTMGKSLGVWQVIGREDQDSPDWSEGALERGLAVALAYNDRNLGAVAGFDLSSNEIPVEAKPYIDLFYKRAKDLVNTKTVADVAVLRSFASTAFSPARSNVSTTLFEQSLILAKIPFAIIFDRHLRDLSAYKVLVLADQDALSDTQVADIRKFVEAGGSVVATGRTSLFNEWRLRRAKFALADVLGVDKPPGMGKSNTPHRTEVGSARVVYIPGIEPAIESPSPQIDYSFPNQYWHLPKNHEDLVASVRWAAHDRLSAEVKAPDWVTIELARQEKGPLLLHIVNYKPKVTVEGIQATIRHPANFRIKEATLVTPEDVTGQKLRLAAAQDSISVVIPSIRFYALIVMNLEGS